MDDDLQAAAYACELEHRRLEEMDDFNKRHTAAMEEVQKANSSGVNIHGKLYTTVATRAAIFRKNFGCLGRLRVADFEEQEKRLRMRAVVELYVDGTWIEFAEGRAEEIRDSSAITRTSALEVCETSAYGRALANFGLHGGEFASANEVEHAIKQQGDRSGRPDTSRVDPDMAFQYAERMYEIVSANNSERAHKLHVELNEDDALYTAAMDEFKTLAKENGMGKTEARDKWSKLVKVNGATA